MKYKIEIYRYKAVRNADTNGDLGEEIEVRRNKALPLLIAREGYV